ncbi:chaperone for protein-folding within the ER, fungal-domain-containing protein [Mycena filopes]|nr:chaperone for protein-folding within the ER, fungal-domain-containing protein [Mycena filopes]
MLLKAILTLALTATASAQFDAGHNTTSIVGTWSSGTQHVVTGAGFANPAQETFTYPKTPGVGYAFSDDGWYEVARYRFAANGSHPECIIGTVIWAHGNYQLFDDGSIVLTPIGDGYQQVQSPCTQDETNFVQPYNLTETFTSWRIYTDVTYGPKLHLFQFDGSPVAPLFRLSDQPNMLPKQKLRNNQVTVVTTTSDGLVTVQTVTARHEPNGKRHDSPQRRSWNNLWAW